MLEHHWTPTIYTDLEGSVGGINWSGQSGGVCYGPGVDVGTGMISPHAFTYLIGADIGWNPVTNLNFDLELMYQHVTQDAPSGNIGTIYNTGRLRPGRLGRRFERLPGSSPRHPLLLIATRSVEPMTSPERKLRGFSFVARLFSAVRRRLFKE